MLGKERRREREKGGGGKDGRAPGDLDKLANPALFRRLAQGALFAVSPVWSAVAKRAAGDRSAAGVGESEDDGNGSRGRRSQRRSARRVLVHVQQPSDLP